MRYLAVVADIGQRSGYGKVRQLGRLVGIFDSADLDRVVTEAQNAIESGESMTDAVRRIASTSGVSRRELYEAVLRSKS